VSIPAQMQAVIAPTAHVGDMTVGSVPTPQPGPGEVLVRVHAAALNRADLLQRRGLYPPPAGASDIIGLEVAGTVAVADGPWSVGQRVMAVVTGGGYGDYAVVPTAELLPIPDQLSDTDAAAIPEAFLTAWLNLITLADLHPGESLFVHAGASGVGSAALQLARAMDVHTYTSAGDDTKRAFCAGLGARLVRDSRAGGHAQAVREATNGRGVDVVLDMLGAPAWDDNCAMLAHGGRLLLLGFLAGAKGVVDLGPVLTRSLTVKGTTLRRTSATAKAALVATAGAWLLPRFANGTLVPVIDRVYARADVAAAHQRMEANLNIGKIILSHV
jgi:putative PIG3 family NAD(P)H quinone oxidoreductase